MRIPPRFRSTRFVLTFWYTVLLLAAFAVFGTGVYLYLRHMEEAELERNLLEEVDWVSRLVDLERHRIDFFAPFDALSTNVEDQIIAHYQENPRNYTVRLTTIYGRVLYQSPQGVTGLVSALALPPEQTVVQTIRDAHGGSLRVASRRTDPFVVQIAYSEQEMTTVMRHLMSIFAFLVPVVLFVSISGGWFMAGMILHPVSQITNLANKISAEHLDQRIPEREVPDEFGNLIATINRMFGRLQKSFAETREFSLSVAHELKTPLTILKGESELALTHPLTQKEMQELAATYLDETVRLSHIVDDLLTLAKADSAQIAISHSPVELQALVNDIVDDAQILSTDKGLQVELRVNEPAVVMGDELRLRQLLRILVSNAVQYTDAGGSISISSIVRNGEARISIADTGIGIASEHVTRIFERFYRVDEARSRAKGGSGLGLAIAKWIVEAHKGGIEVESSPGKGSVFTVKIPTEGIEEGERKRL
ncbi:MAG TPA: ATP-binding protein [Bacteroidota bacterium]|nr:ATP-binding protein [Bacteroidota bacterium]